MLQYEMGSAWRELRARVRARREYVQALASWTRIDPCRLLAPGIPSRMICLQKCAWKAACLLPSLVRPCELRDRSTAQRAVSTHNTLTPP